MKLRQIRLGLTQHQLGERTGIHPSRLSEMDICKKKASDAVALILEEALVGFRND